MAMDFGILGLIPLGLIILGLLGIGMVVVIRATIRQQVYLAKWDFLRTVEDADERQRRSRYLDERIPEVNDQTQRGNAS